VTGALAYLPQYVAEVGGVALCVSFVIGALPALITGRTSARPDWSARRVRAAATLGVLLGGAVVLVAFVIPAEPSGGFPGGHWGTTGSEVVMGVWLFCVAAITGWNLRREIRFLRRRD